jgi:rubrerythrin
MTKKPKAGGAGSLAPIESVDDLLVRAYAMEVEAADRYEEFAAQMELHNNREVESLFRDLAKIERKHAVALAADLASRGVDAKDQAALSNPREEGLETAPSDALHYLMTPYHALQIALSNEQRAVDCFTTLVASATRPEVRAAAKEFELEEIEHVQLIQAWLARVEKPPENWAQDPDEPRNID